jgi:uncharacterized membrane protein YhaH (DUF805 family)
MAMLYRHHLSRFIIVIVPDFVVVILAVLIVILTVFYRPHHDSSLSSSIWQCFGSEGNYTKMTQPFSLI